MEVRSTQNHKNDIQDGMFHLASITSAKTPWDGLRFLQSLPKTPQRRPPGPPKRLQNCPLASQDGPMTAPERPQNGPKTPPQTPLRRQDGPKGLLEPPSTLPVFSFGTFWTISKLDFLMFFWCYRCLWNCCFVTFVLGAVAGCAALLRC